MLSVVGSCFSGIGDRFAAAAAGINNSPIKSGTSPN
jgi:hypothetical protein